MFEHEIVSALDAQRRDSGKSYLEFLRDETLSLGLYVLGAGDQDTQQPHKEDEVYYVIEGRARFQCEDEDCEVTSGSVLFVKAGVEHRFHTITEDPTVLVFFLRHRKAAGGAPRSAHLILAVMIDLSG